MANIITAGNSTNGGTQITTDTSGTLNIVTGSGSGSNAITIDASQAVTIPNTLAVTSNQTVGGNLTVTGTLTATGGVSGGIKAGTAVASTSGTSIDFTGIPSTAKRITIIFSGVSTNGTSYKQVQIGSGSFTTSGYTGRIGYILQPNGAVVASLTTGMGIDASQLASETATGIMTIDLLGSNIYVSSSQVSSAGSAVIGFANSTINLGGVLDRVRITTVNGTDTFDAGSINIFYE